MSGAALGIAIGVVSLLSAVVVVGALVWGLRRASRGRGEEMRASYPDAELGPELGQYRGCTGAFPRARNTSWIALTPTMFVVRPIVGNAVVIPVTEITGSSVQKSFRGHWNGQPVLVLETARGEIGLTVAAPEQWQAGLVR